MKFLKEIKSENYSYTLGQPKDNPVIAIRSDLERDNNNNIMFEIEYKDGNLSELIIGTVRYKERTMKDTITDLIEKKANRIK